MRCPGNFKTQAPGAPDSFSLGFLKIRGLRSLPGRFTYSVGNDPYLVFHLDKLVRRGVSLSFFRAAMYKSHKAGSLFRKHLEFDDVGPDAKRRSRLDPSVLALTPPRGWVHEVYRSKRGMLFHTYVGPTRAAILSYACREGPPGDCKRLHEINRRLQWASDDWVVQKDHIEVGTDGQTTDCPLPGDVRKEVRGAIGRARKHLDLPQRTTPAETVEAIHASVGGTRSGRAMLDDLAIELGCLWGQAVCDALNWEWCQVSGGDGAGVFAVATKNRSHYVAPTSYMKQQLARRDRTANTTLLLFNLLKARRMPASGARGYRLLG